MTAVPEQSAGRAFVPIGLRFGAGEPGMLFSELCTRIGRGGIIGAAVVFALMYLGLFHQMLWRQFAMFSAGNLEDWGHSYVIPFIAGAYVWKNREAIAAAPVRVFLPGLGVLLLGVVCYVYFIVKFSTHMFQGASAILTLSGVVLLVLGPEFFRRMMFPIAYLGFAITIAEMVMLQITFRLKLMASVGSHVLLNTIGIENDLRGNILYIYDGAATHPLNVADACSGMRMVVAFVALSVAVAFLSCRQWWQRILIVMLSIPVAILMNVVRVATLAGLTLIDPDLSVGDAHTFIGTALLIPALGLFLGCVWAVKKITPDEVVSTAGGGGAV